MRNQPLVSVIMPFHNTEKYIKEALDSILCENQVDFELIAVNDASTDGSKALVESCNDRRIRLIDLKDKSGVSVARNLAVKESNGKYIALLDSDDISCPQRLQKQVSFLEGHPDIDVLSSYIEDFDEENRSLQTRETENDRIKVEFLFHSAIFQTALMVRGDDWRAMDRVYRPEAVAEGYDLWVRKIKDYSFANIPEVLVNKRVHKNMTTNQGKGKVFNQADLEIRKQLLEKTGLSPSHEELAVHELSCYIESRNQRVTLSAQEKENISVWFEKIATANKTSGLFNQGVLEEMLEKRRSEL